jgi:hypothetical protein
MPEIMKDFYAFKYKFPVVKSDVKRLKNVKCKKNGVFL